jgi:very-short-patch-repair endonuclease
MQLGGDLSRWLESVAPGRTGCVFADDVADVRNVFEAMATSATEPARVVTLTWEKVPSLSSELGLLVASLAKAALDFFPTLYGTSEDHSAPGGTRTETSIEGEAQAITRRMDDVLGHACRAILKACRRGDVPNLGKMQAAEQVHQFALAIDPKRLVVIISVLESPTESAPVRALAQGAEWLAANTKSRVVLVLPAALGNRTELDHVSYTACLFVEQEKPSRPRTAPPPVEKGATPLAGTKKGPALPEVGTSPVLGRPAPRSDAEKQLFEQIQNDSNLAPLFGFNLRVETVFKTTPIVDVLWREGRLAIEIDGSEHRGVRQYSLDRQRDYQLALSDYMVLRFTSGRVIEYGSGVVEEIREAVRHIQKRGIKP